MKYLPECLESLIRLEIPNLELIIVDSNSNDGTKEYLKRMESRVDLTFIRSLQRITWSEANQIGLTLSHGEWVCFSNPDIVFNPEFRAMTNYLQNQEDVSIAAPQLVYPDGTGP